MINNYNFIGKNEETLAKAIEQLDLWETKIKNTNIDLWDKAYYEFVKDFGCSYDFNEMFGSVSLINSDSEDLEELIDHYNESGAKNWLEYSNYITDTLIDIYKSFLKV